MKTKTLCWLPGAIALLLAASPMIPSFTQTAVAQSVNQPQRGTRFERLNLTDAQKAQMRQIRESTRQQIEAILTPEQKAQMATARQQRQRPNLNLTDEQKARIRTIRQNAQSQIEAMLTPEQKQQLQQLRQERQQRRQQRNQPQSN